MSASPPVRFIKVHLGRYAVTDRVHGTTFGHLDRIVGGWEARVVIETPRFLGEFRTRDEGARAILDTLTH